MKLEDLRHSIPDGWLNTFGEMLVDEVNSVAPDSKVIEAKEKYGGLRLSLETKHNYEEVIGIVDKYEVLSQNICAICGKPDVKITNAGWIYPLCKKCYESRINSKRPYDEVTFSDDDGRMADSYRIGRWTEESGYTEIDVDITETANRIREEWRRRHGEN